MVQANPLSEAVSEYLEWNRRYQSPATLEQRRFILLATLLPWAEAEGITEPKQLTDKAMERFTDHLRAKTTRNGKPLSMQTIRTYLRQVRAFLNKQKVERGDFRQPKAPERLLDVLTPVEIRAMQDAALSERDLLIIRLLTDTGIRASELLGLRAKDVHKNGAAFWITVIGKGNKERKVPLPPKTYILLSQFAMSGPRMRYARGETDTYPDSEAEFLDGYIFVAKRSRLGAGGTRLTRSGLEQVIRHTARRAGITRRVWTHLFRHSYATQMLSQGMEPLTLAKIMGHADLKMIMSVYSHLTVNDTYAAVMRAMERTG